MVGILDIVNYGEDKRDKRLGRKIAVTFAGSSLPEEFEGNWILDYRGADQKSLLKKVFRVGKALEKSLTRGAFYLSKEINGGVANKLKVCGGKFPVRLSFRGEFSEKEGMVYCESSLLFRNKSYYFKEG